MDREAHHEILFRSRKILLNAERTVDMPKVSCIVPVYNVEKYLRRCMDSLLAQTIDDYEIICVNDCSPDGSLAILEEYRQTYPD